ncbi:TetR/AcrR family transcriptional regulator [Dactylosporangium sp. NPDC051541]|uniref:TetR/AcrR family transcriptional regulator n=1 Tax=Dactylosporangium sp. NPDC051541 TaxID=3363977 RepID=UPI003791818F
MRAAVPLFVQNGYRGAPLAAVADADAAQLTQPGLLHHFPSKEHLLMAVLEERDSESRAAMREALQEGGDAALHALEDLVERNAGTPELVQLFTVLVGEAVAADHPAHAFFVDRYDHIRDRITAAIRHGQETGTFRTDTDPETVATLVIAMMDGLQIQWLLHRELDMNRTFRQFVTILRHHLTTHDQPS